MRILFGGTHYFLSLLSVNKFKLVVNRMKNLSLIALLILFSFKVNAQIYKKNLSIADVINGRSNIEVYDYIQNKKVDKD